MIILGKTEPPIHTELVFAHSADIVPFGKVVENLVEGLKQDSLESFHMDSGKSQQLTQQLKKDKLDSARIN